MWANQYTGRRSLEERYLAKVDVRGPDECWPWMGARTKGYGVIGEGGKEGKMKKATHVLFYLRNGYWPPEGRTANHHCDNPVCNNPAHLYLGTLASNNRDRERRGRGADIRGERNPMAKLTDVKVRKIKRDLAQGVPHAEIARRFKISEAMIHSINTGRRWGHVKA